MSVEGQFGHELRNSAQKSGTKKQIIQTHFDGSFGALPQFELSVCVLSKCSGYDSTDLDGVVLAAFGHAEAVLSALLYDVHGALRLVEVPCAAIPVHLHRLERRR